VPPGAVTFALPVFYVSSPDDVTTALTTIDERGLRPV